MSDLPSGGASSNPGGQQSSLNANVLSAQQLQALQHHHQSQMYARSTGAPTQPAMVTQQHPGVNQAPNNQQHYVTQNTQIQSGSQPVGQYGPNVFNRPVPVSSVPGATVAQNATSHALPQGTAQLLPAGQGQGQQLHPSQVAVQQYPGQQIIGQTHGQSVQTPTSAHVMPAAPEPPAAPAPLQYSLPEDVRTRLLALREDENAAQRAAVFRLVAEEEARAQHNTLPVLLLCVSTANVTALLRSEDASLQTAVLECVSLAAYRHPPHRALLFNDLHASIAHLTRASNGAVRAAALRALLNLVRGDLARCHELVARCRREVAVLHENLVAADQSVIALTLALLTELLQHREFLLSLLQPSTHLPHLVQADDTGCVVSEDPTLSTPMPLHSILGSGLSADATWARLERLEKQHQLLRQPHEERKAQRTAAADDPAVLQQLPPDDSDLPTLPPRPFVVQFCPAALVCFALHQRFSSYVHATALGFLRALFLEDSARVFLQTHRVYCPGAANARLCMQRVLRGDRSHAQLSLPCESLCSLLLGVTTARAQVTALPLADAEYVSLAALTAETELPARVRNGPYQTHAQRQLDSVGLLYTLTSHSADVVLSTCQLLILLLTSFSIVEYFSYRSGIPLLIKLLRRPQSVEERRRWSIEQVLVQEHVMALLALLCQSDPCLRSLAPAFAPLASEALIRLPSAGQPLAPEAKHVAQQHSLIERPPGYLHAALALSLMLRHRELVPQVDLSVGDSLVLMALYMLRSFPFKATDTSPDAFPAPGSDAFNEHSHAAFASSVSCMCLFNVCWYRSQPNIYVAQVSGTSSGTNSLRLGDLTLESKYQKHCFKHGYDELMRLLAITRAGYINPPNLPVAPGTERVRAYIWDNIYTRCLPTHNDLSPEALLLRHDQAITRPPGATREETPALPDFCASLMAEEQFGEFKHQLPLFARFTLPALLAVVTNNSDLLYQPDSHTGLRNILTNLAAVLQERTTEVEAANTRAREREQRRQTIVYNIRMVEDGLRRRRAALFRRAEELRARTEELPASGLSTLEDVGAPESKAWEAVVGQLSAAEVQRDLAELQSKSDEYALRRVKYGKIIGYLQRVQSVCARALEECSQVRHTLVLLWASILNLINTDPNAHALAQTDLLPPSLQPLIRQVHGDYEAVIKQAVTAVEAQQAALQQQMQQQMQQYQQQYQQQHMQAQAQAQGQAQGSQAQGAVMLPPTGLPAAASGGAVPGAYMARPHAQMYVPQGVKGAVSSPRAQAPYAYQQFAGPGFARTPSQTYAPGAYAQPHASTVSVAATKVPNAQEDQASKKQRLE